MPRAHVSRSITVSIICLQARTPLFRSSLLFLALESGLPPCLLLSPSVARLFARLFVLRELRRDESSLTLLCLDGRRGMSAVELVVFFKDALDDTQLQAVRGRQNTTSSLSLPSYVDGRVRRWT